MKAKNYTTLLVSQAISAVVEVETENVSILLEKGVSQIEENDGGWLRDTFIYSLSEALHAIEEFKKHQSSVSCGNSQRDLFSAWQQDGGRMNGEAVSEFLISLFKE